jgi:hypothetical protein
MASVVGSRGAFNSNVYEIDVGDHVLTCVIAITLLANAGATTAVDTTIGIAFTSET